MPEEQLRRAEVYGRWWPEPPLNYRELKKLALHHARGFRGDIDHKFFALLRDEIQRINKTFLRLAHGALRDKERRQRSKDREAPKASRKTVGQMSATEPPAKATHPCRARLCNEYARVNAICIQEILVRYDEISRSSRGSDFMESLRKNHSGDVSFFHSPMRIRMEAMETMDAMSAVRESRLDDGDGESPFRPLVRLCNADLMCPSCLNVLHRPVALSCGHVYCFPCLIEVCGPTHAYGILNASMTDVESMAPCCKCLERDVYRNASHVPELESFVRLQYPADWEQRDKEAKKAEAKRKTLLQRQRKKLEEAGGLIHPFQILW